MYKIDELELRKLLEEKNLTDAQAASCLGVSKETIRRRRSALGIPPKPKHPSEYYDLTAEQDQMLEQLYSRGLNDYEVASEMKLGRDRLRKWRKKHNINSKTNKKFFSKKDVEKMYSLYQKGHTLSSIGKILGCRRTTVSKCLKKYGFRYEEYRPKPPIWVGTYILTKEQEQVLIGDLLGDGTLVETSENSAYYQFGHATEQEPFMRWKAAVMYPLTSHVGSNFSHNVVSGKTWTSPELGRWRKIFYPEGKKRISRNIIDLLDPFGLAVWFMGDGSLNRNTPIFHVGLQEDVPKIVEALNAHFKSIFTYKRYANEWHIKVIDVDAFCALICPYIIEYFKYKIPEKFHTYFDFSKSQKYDVFIKSKEFRVLPKKKQEEILEKVCVYYEQRSFPYPVYNYRIIKKDCKSLLDSDNVNSNTLGRKTCNHFMPHRFDARRYDSDPMSYWTDKSKYRAFIKNRLMYSDGMVNDASIRTGISLKGIPANFPPSIAKHIYKKYGKKGSCVLDFSGGYGGRLLGWMASGLKGKYYGVEPYIKSYRGLRNMSNYCSSFFGLDAKDIHLYNKPFEDIVFKENKFDLVFSSPPYFGLEIYSDEDTQSIKRYPNYDIWLDKFWRALVFKCWSYLKERSYFIYSIGNYKKYNLVSDTVGIVLNKGFKRVPDLLEIPYHNVYKNVEKTERLFIFQKIIN